MKIATTIINAVVLLYMIIVLIAAIVRWKHAHDIEEERWNQSVIIVCLMGIINQVHIMIKGI